MAKNSVRLKYKLYKAKKTVSSFWRGFSWSTKLDSRYISREIEEENSRGTLFAIITTWSCDFDKNLHLKYSNTETCR